MTNTTFENYQERASRTLALLGSNAIDGAHMVIGVTTELVEMTDGALLNDAVNVREEHGDCNWYIANECNIYNLNFKNLYERALVFDKSQFSLGRLADLHKRELAYGKVMDTVLLEEELVRLIRVLLSAAKKFSFSYEESLRINISKLYKRYPEKFSNEAALNRDLDAEYETLK